MDFEWSMFSAQEVRAEEVAESFEDPYSVRLMPDQGAISEMNRFFCLGMTLTSRGIFSVYSSNGKQVKVVAARQMTPEEEFFYNRKVREYL
ncbi:MAG: hypothetical protein HC904_14200 [Blastochloris sp.]|nr:hypothetical protein [Blastochloris sp.]